MPSNVTTPPAAYVMAEKAAVIVNVESRSEPAVAQRRVAELEGALEASRDRIKELEAHMQERDGRPSCAQVVEEQRDIPHFGGSFQSPCGESNSASIVSYPESVPSSARNGGMELGSQ